MPASCFERLLELLYAVAAHLTGDHRDCPCCQRARLRQMEDHAEMYRMQQRIDQAREALS